jgi:hypothetical protein
MTRKFFGLILLAAACVLVPAARAQTVVIGNSASEMPRYASDPYTCTSATRSTFYYNTTSEAAKICNGTAWTALGSGGATALSELTDATITDPVVDDGLFFNGAKWVNVTAGLPSRADNDGTVVIATTDRNSVVNVGHATANAVSIAEAGVTAGHGFIGGWQTILCTTGAGLTTIDPAGSVTINGAATLTFSTNDCARIFVPTEADTNYRAVISPGRRVWTCVVIVGDPGAASSALADDNDSPAACSNDTGKDVTITAMAIYTNGGTPTATPILTAGAADSIVTGAITGSAGAWVAGTVNGSPVLHSFSANGATCSVTPCTANMNITTAGGVAKYMIFKLVGTAPTT